MKKLLRYFVYLRIAFRLMRDLRNIIKNRR